jgi:DNA-binding CsgD family transcriptional regulator
VAFVGRDRELAAAGKALDSGPALIVIEGEAGIGKTRLVAELARRHRMLAGSAPPYSQPYTLAPVVDAIRGSTGPAGLELSPLAGALRPLFPEWTAQLPAALEPAEDYLAARHRLFRALLEMLVALDVPVLAVEDVHWADDTTLEFLLYLAAQRPLPLSLLLTRRPGDRGSALLTRLSSRAPAAGSLLHVALGPLDIAGTGRLVSALLDGEPASEEFARFLHERTDGVPLAVEESIRLMRDRADVARRHGGWARRGLNEIHVPAAVRDAVLERVARLQPDCRAVLCAAAVLADPADPATLAATAGLREDSTAYLTAVESGLLREHLVARYGFAHALPARAVYDSIPAAERRILHARAAQHLAVAGSTPPAVLSRHFRDAGDVERWMHCAQQTVEDALALGDEAKAASALHDLLTHASLSPAVVVELARQLPWSALRVEQLTDLVEVLRRTRNAAAVAQLSTEQAALLRLCLAELLATKGEVDQMRRELETSLPDLEPGSAEAVRAMLVLGWPHDTDQPREVLQGWLRQAAAAIPALPPVDQVRPWRVLAMGLLEIGDDRGWLVGARLPADTAMPPSVLAMRELNLGQAAISWGRFTEARKHLMRASDAAATHHYQRVSANARAELIYLDWYEGRWRALVERAGSMIDSEASETARLGCQMIIALVHGATGLFAPAEQEMRQVMAGLGRRGDGFMTMEPAGALGRWYLAQGRVDCALRVTDEPTQLLRRRQVWFWGRELLPARVAALCAANRGDEATALVYEFADGAADLTAPSVTASLLMCRALSSTDGILAARLFAEAADVYEAMPRPYAALLARAHQAERLSRTTSSRQELAVIVEGLLQGLTNLGASADLERLRHTLNVDGGAASSRRRAGRPGYGDQLSPRELDVVRLVIAGHTNRQIADALHRSPKTVATQLNAAMRKLNVATRTALAVAALKQGITVD